MRNPTINGLVAAVVLLGLYAVAARTIDNLRAKPDPFPAFNHCSSPSSFCEKCLKTSD